MSVTNRSTTKKRELLRVLQAEPQHTAPWPVPGMGEKGASGAVSSD